MCECILHSLHRFCKIKSSLFSFILFLVLNLLLILYSILQFRRTRRLSVWKKYKIGPSFPKPLRPYRAHESLNQTPENGIEVSPRHRKSCFREHLHNKMVHHYAQCNLKNIHNLLFSRIRIY